MRCDGENELFVTRWHRNMGGLSANSSTCPPVGGLTGDAVGLANR